MLAAIFLPLAQRVTTPLLATAYPASFFPALHCFLPETQALNGSLWPQPAWSAHVSQVESPCALNFPAGQPLQCVASVETPDPSLSPLDVVVKCPAEHVSQLESPFALYFVAGQLLQYLPPAETPDPSLSPLDVVVKCPAEHVSQLESPFALYFDAGHHLQCVAPVDTPDPSESPELVVVNAPARHVVHPLDSLLIVYLPASHLVQ